MPITIIDLIFSKNGIEKILAHYGVESCKNQYNLNFVTLLYCKTYTQLL